MVVFVYGGAWSSGDKSMYGALSGQIAERLDALVCCPNYSHFPQGCVDDMIQDIVDCIQWIHDSIQDYGGDKNKLMLVGHSAGAHLGTMAILELLHDQCAHGALHPTQTSIMQFHDSYYHVPSDPSNQAGDALEESSGSSESFAVVSENGNGEGRMDNNASSLDSSTLVSMVEVSQGDMTVSMEQSSSVIEEITEGDLATKSQEESDTLEKEKGGEGCVTNKGVGNADVEEDSCEDEDDNDSVVTVRPKDIERHATLVDLYSSVKAFVGLAGVYHIGDHYEHEAWRGVEEYSSMTPAMYGPDHFDRFSPTTILHNLDAPISLPRMVLVHGTKDIVVPVSSSQKMTDALVHVSANVSLRLIPGCDHYDVCLDLMQPSRHFHSSLMTILLETTNSVF